MRKILITYLIVITATVSWGKASDDFEKIRKEYSRYNAVVTERQEFYLFDLVDDSVNVTQTVSLKTLMLNEFSKEFTNDQIVYDSFSKLIEKEAYTLVPNGNKYSKVMVENFQESSDMDASIFYDDSRKLKFAYPSLQQGAVAALNYKLSYVDPHFIRSAFFQSYIPVINDKVILKIHENIDVGYQLRNADQANIEVKSYQKGKYKYIEFEVANVDRFKYHPGEYYSLRTFCPHVIIYVKEARLATETKQYYGDVDDLYRFSHQYVTEANMDDNEELSALVSELTKGLSDEEKARQIYYWVQKNIKYIAYTDGYDGFRPMKAVDVFKKRFGDCKGMSSLIRKMMLLSGLDAKFTWVGTRHIPYSYTQVPLPITDNHMIVSYLVNDSVIVLDGTFKYLDYGIVPYHIQGKEIMIGINDDKYLIHKLSVTPSEYSQLKDSVCISLDQDLVIGKAKRIQTGFNKVEIAHAMDGVKPDDYSKRFSRIFEKGNNKFIVDSFQVRNLFEYDQPAEIDYGFKLQDYCKHFGDEVYINLNLDKSYQNLVADTSNIISPIENDFYCLEKYITVFEVPEGYQVDFIPEGGKYQSKDFGFNIQYKQEGNRIIMQNVIRFEFFVLLEDQLADWNKMISELNKQYRSTVVLKKI